MEVYIMTYINVQMFKDINGDLNPYNVGNFSGTKIYVDIKNPFNMLRRKIPKIITKLSPISNPRAAYF